MKRSGWNSSASSPQYRAATWVSPYTGLTRDEGDARLKCIAHISKTMTLPAGTAIENFPVSIKVFSFDPGMKEVTGRTVSLCTSFGIRGSAGNMRSVSRINAAVYSFCELSVCADSTTKQKLTSLSMYSLWFCFAFRFANCS